VVAGARLATATFGIAAILLTASGIAIRELPVACGQIGTPNLDFFAKLTLVIGGAFWIVGVVATIRGRRLAPPRMGLVAIALVEVAVGVGLAVYYQHHFGWYDRCG
jgi:hypothetical protein